MSGVLSICGCAQLDLFFKSVGAASLVFCQAAIASVPCAVGAARLV